MLWVDGGPRLKQVQVNKTICIPKNCSHEFPCWNLSFEFLFRRWNFVMIFHGLTLALGFRMMHPRFSSCHDAVKKFLTFLLIVWLKLLANFDSWSFHLHCQHVRSPSCTNLPILKNSNNVTHMFLWNAMLDSNVPLSNLSIVLNQFISLLLAKLVGCCQRSSTSLSHKSALPYSPALHFKAQWHTVLTSTQSSP